MLVGGWPFDGTAPAAPDAKTNATPLRQTWCPSRLAHKCGVSSIYNRTTLFTALNSNRTAFLLCPQPQLGLKKRFKCHPPDRGAPPPFRHA